METTTPFVSVLMTAYNRENFIAEAIESVLASTNPDFELIVVDDGSTDGTVKIVQHFAEKDSRIRLYINEHNLGDYPNRNRAASLATGTFIMYVDSDDRLYEETIAVYAGYVKTYPGLNFVIYNDKGIAEKEPGFLSSAIAVNEHYFKQSVLMSGPGGIFIRKSFFNAIGCFPEKYGPANDMYFNVKAACATDVLINPHIPVFYRKHENQESNNMFSYIFNNYRYNRDLVADLALPLTPVQKSYVLKKNKRRFVVNAFRFFKTTRDVKKTMQLFKSADFSFKDIIQGIFH